MKYKVIINTQAIKEIRMIIAWCTEKFGPKKIKGKKRNRNKWSLSISVIEKRTTFCFRDKKQATFFALTWQ